MSETLGMVTPEIVSDRLVLGTTLGLCRAINEDSFTAEVHDRSARICIADGHWGQEAGQLATAYWASVTEFPRSRQQAQDHVARLEAQLFNQFGNPVMDERTDFTPETSFIALEIDGDNLTVVGYGDCRLLIVRDQQKLYSLPRRKSWLGAFSHLGLRQRSPARQATIFHKSLLQKGDYVLVYTDGVDECVYEKPTISTAELAGFTALKDPQPIFNAVMQRVFEKGAEDNATLAIWSQP